jgi:hypothetical protein
MRNAEEGISFVSMMMIFLMFIRLPWLGQCGRAAAGCARVAAALRC